MRYICIYDSRNIQAEEFAEQLCKIYKWDVYDEQTFAVESCDNDCIFITLGGDGLLLYIVHLLSKVYRFPKIYPINYGTLGFLTNNRTQAVNLEKKINMAKPAVLRFLEVSLTTLDGKKIKEHALNDVSILRQTGQAAHMKISVNGVVRIQDLTSDGIVIATPAGSTAYNFSVGGPIFGLESRLLGLYPVSPFRPRYWRGALLNDASIIDIEILQVHKRPVSVNIDSKHFHNIERMSVALCNGYGVELLFDKQFTMEDKILSEQFSI